jgi:lipid A 3-O-deacylase
MPGPAAGRISAKATSLNPANRLACIAMIILQQAGANRLAANHSTMNLISRFSAVALLSTISTSFAGQEIASKNPVVEEVSPFAKGRMELQIGAGAFHSIKNSDSRPEVTDVGGVIRAGWMLTDVSGDGFLRGNWEFLIEAAASGIVNGPGDVLAGGAILLRYNFVQDGNWVPYFQLGGGGTYSDMHEDRSQRLLGSEWSFNLQAGLGLRYLWSDQCALFIEATYRHISNADSADRNIGLNSVGGYVGVSLFF